MKVCLVSCRTCDGLFREQVGGSPRVFETASRFLGGFPTIMGTFCRVPIIRTRVMGSILGSPSVGKLPFKISEKGP